ncbi:MAG: hypothetical protein WCP77_14425 [Roseococcus sp.]
MSADQEFARDPLAFMSRNIVIPSVPSGEPLGDWGVDEDGCVLVYVKEHPTYQQGNQAQITRQNQQLANVFATKGEELAGIVSPDNYMSDQDGAFFWNATNFGVLNQQRTWTFYTHRWKKLGMVSYLHGGTAPSALPDGLA